MKGLLLLCCSLVALADLERGSVRAEVKAGSDARDKTQGLKAVTDLVRILKDDPSESVRVKAIEGLASIAPNNPEVVSVLLHALQSDRSSHVRSMAGFVLRDIKPRSRMAAAILKRALQERSREVRIQVAYVLATTTAPEVAIPFLLSSPQGDDGTERPFISGDIDGIASALSETGVKGVPLLYKAFRHPDATARARAVLAFWYLWVDFRETRADAGKCVPGIIALLRDPAAVVRANAAETLGMIGDKKAIEELTRAIADRDASVRYAVIAALSNFGEEAIAAVPALVWALIDRDPDVRARAAGGLAVIVPEACKAAAEATVPALRRMLKSAIGALRRLAANALE
jgi:HEAT repeat protein